MAKTMTLKRHYEIEVDVEVEYTIERDDDGCGSPSVTGNSMTGARGRAQLVFQSAWLDEGNHDAVVAAVQRAIEDDHEGLEEVAREADEDHG